MLGARQRRQSARRDAAAAERGECLVVDVDSVCIIFTRIETCFSSSLLSLPSFAQVNSVLKGGKVWKACGKVCSGMLHGVCGTCEMNLYLCLSQTYLPLV